ncbi:ATP-binding cassette domain-containing protein [Massilibacterium senegalense]|uniref:ATP-binding cassette domain-containing protein n=1 Tax=Massilibacterium senegalense TaxID=1632858 RepID=UPI0007802A72|nr:ATP-binding cassette domain-containing protein [Massilibacterium senegalense]
MDNYIIVKNLSKKLKGHYVLKNINLSISKGEICGFKGRNGSGKTMFLRCISGLLRPSEGEIFIDGSKLEDNFPKSMGIIIEYPGFIPSYTGFKNLKLIAQINKKIDDNEIKKVLKAVGLDPDDGRKVKKYSLGMKQRLGIAQAIMEKPELLILDEPTNALDREGIALMRNIFLKMKNQGTTILLASHDHDELKAICDNIYTIDNGILIEKESNLTVR